MRNAAALVVLTGTLALVPCAGACGSSGTSPADPGNGNGPAGHDSGAPGVGPDGGGGGRDGGGSETDAGGGSDAGPVDAASQEGSTGGALRTVFLIMMENHSLSTLKASSSAPYLQGLMSQWGHAEHYTTPPKNHPSEPNYIWLEAGGALGIKDDSPPAANHQSTTNHLVTLLDRAGVSWKAYGEGVTADTCPLTDTGSYVTRHIPMLFFDDVTDDGDAGSSKCATHVRPYGELASDLQANSVARYNFIVPDLCDDMHGLSASCGAANFDEIGAGDTWLKNEVPKILASDAYKSGGVLFILWDEGDESPIPGSVASDGPIPLVVLSPKAKPKFTSPTPFTHSSMLRTVQEIFGVTPLLGDAANATDLSEFFTSFP